MNKVISKEYVEKNYIHKDVLRKIRNELYIQYMQGLSINSMKSFILKCKIEILDKILEDK